MAPVDLETLFVFDLDVWHMYGLFFLLGSFAVATLSDVRRLSAQSEFPEVWGLFAVSILALDLGLADWRPTVLFAIKWGLILVLSLLSWERVGPILRLAKADVLACAALASLLSPGFVLVFWVLLKLGSYVLRPLLPRVGNSYPFMPVVTVATMAVLGIAIFLVPALV